MSLGAIILCGGKSRRMGRPKAWLPFGDEVLLGRVARLVGEAVEHVVVVGAGDQGLPALSGEIVIARDRVADRGPLQGIEVGLSALPASVALAYATATDAPMLAPAWIARLVERIGDADLAIPRVGGYLQPLAALYRRSTVLPAAAALLAADRLRPAYLVDEVRSVILDEDAFRDIDPSLGTLRNLNTPEDHRAALAELGLSTTRVVVEFFGVPPLRAGAASIVVEANRLGEALRLAAEACPGLAGTVIFGRDAHPAYKVSLNGDRFVDDPDTPLVDGDALLLLAADVGG